MLACVRLQARVCKCVSLYFVFVFVCLRSAQAFEECFNERNEQKKELREQRKSQTNREKETEK